MKRVIILIVCLLAVNYLLSAEQSGKNGFVKEIKQRGKRMRIYGAYHRVPSRADVIPSAAEKQEAKLRRTQELLWPPNPRPQILDVLPYYGWWGELLYIFGQGFSPIYASNVAHFHSNAFTAIETTDKTENEFKVGIPAGVRSGFPNVASF